MKTRAMWFFISITALITGAVIDLAGLSPWPLVFVLFSTTSIIFAQKTGYVFAIAAATVTLLFALACWYQIAPFLPGDLRIKTYLIEVSVTLAIVVLLGLRRNINFPSKVSLSYFWPASIVPLISASTIFTLGLAGNLGYSWAMHNDAVWNIVVSRFVTHDGGVVSSIHSNASPLIPEMLSFSSLSGRDLNSVSSLFEHDMTRAAETWILVALLSSIIGGLISLSIRRINQMWFRVVTAVSVSSLPLAWFSLGYALEFGFYNATLALLLMLTMWLIWQTGAANQYARLGALGLALLVCLAAWGPLALIPASLSLLALLLILKQKIKATTLWEKWFVGLSWTIAIAYGLLVTIPDLRAQSGALGADGGIFEIAPIQAGITIGSCFLVIGLSSWLLRERELLLGICVFTISSLIAITYLALQRGQDVSRWGYYPVKYSWLLMCALLVIATAFALVLIFSSRLRNRYKFISALMAGMFMFALAWQMPIRQPPTYLSVFPVANIISHTGVAKEDEYADRLFSLAVSGRPTIAYKGLDPLSDQFADKWLLQLESKSSQDKVRYWAYFFDPTIQDHLCRALIDWDTEVTIVTTEKDLESKLAINCPEVRYKIQKE